METYNWHNNCINNKIQKTLNTVFRIGCDTTLHIGGETTWYLFSLSEVKS